MSRPSPELETIGRPPGKPDDSNRNPNRDSSEAPRANGAIRGLPSTRDEVASTSDTSDAAQAAAANGAPGLAELAEITTRMRRLERQNTWLKLGVIAILAGIGFFLYQSAFPEGVIVQRTMMESKEIKLIDSTGSPRLFLRMYSRVPVLQLMDANGKPRMSLGLRFDDTPFLDLSDRTGKTRATLEITSEDQPALKLFDEEGAVKFQIN